ncbi:MAG TPA: hypothetical protein VIL21_08415 [Solirubrobacterales bacterium]
MGPLRVTGGGAGQFRVEGGDNSVQGFGAEAGAGELRRAAAAVHAFVVARVGEEWRRACSLLSADEREALERASPSSGPGSGGCAAALAHFTTRVSPSLARAITTVDAASLRRAGERAFLLYTAPPGRTVYAMPMASEDGAWKLGAINGAVLPR